jgi:hypothetical protein
MTPRRRFLYHLACLRRVTPRPARCSAGRLALNVKRRRTGPPPQKMPPECPMSWRPRIAAGGRVPPALVPIAPLAPCLAALDLIGPPCTGDTRCRRRRAHKMIRTARAATGADVLILFPITSQPPAQGGRASTPSADRAAGCERGCDCVRCDSRSF